ncbi:MAG: starch-binding protein [Candidatus Amulumruptor caecigallinarius]|nr:starch-binding protein [Candidatus Amulumruptor caecigallinarius]
MSFFRLSRILPLLAAVLACALPMAAKRVYYENTMSKWTTVKIHYWGDSSSTTWAGVNMNKYDTDPNLQNIYYYDIPDNTTGIIFNNNEGVQTSDIENGYIVNNQVYRYEGNNNSDKGWKALGDIKDYRQLLSDTYVYFNNESTKWVNVYVHYWGAKSSNFPGVKCEAYTANGLKNIYRYKLPAGTIGFMFTNGISSGGRNTGDITGKRMVANQVYGSEGKQLGDISEFENNIPDPDPDPDPTDSEYWLDPATPTQKQPATLYFNRAKSDKLKNTADIYVWIGLITEESSSDNDWKYAPTCAWADLKKYSKYKMSRVDSGKDIYKLEFAAGIENWFGADGVAIKKVAVIFRDADGNVQTSDYFIDLKYTPLTGGFVSASDNEGTVTIVNGRGDELYITPYSKDIVKVFSLNASALKSNEASRTTERRSVTVCAAPSAEYTTTDTDNEYVISITGGTIVKVDKATCRLTFHDNEGTTMLREKEGLRNSPGNSSVTFDAMGDIAFYGAGYNGTNMNIGGMTLTMHNRQTGGWPDSGATYPHNICIPYYVSTNGYGVLFDDHYLDSKMIPSAKGSAFYTAAPTPFAYYYIGGGDIEEVNANYFLLTGKPKMPPVWALGYLTSRYSYQSSAKARECISKMEQNKIPVDAIIYDIHWQGVEYNGSTPKAVGMGALTWDKNVFGDSDDMLNEFKKKNIHNVAIVEPYFSNHGHNPAAPSNYAMLKNNGWFAHADVNPLVDMEWVGYGKEVGLIDVTNPDAMKWFGDRLEDHMKNPGTSMSGWWLDLGEPEKFNGTEIDKTTFKGGTGRQVQNEYGLLWIEGVYNSLSKNHPDMRHFMMPRSGTSGMQRYGVYPWSGDVNRSWGGLAQQIPATVNASMSGVGFLGSDIGGFAGGMAMDNNLYLRWVELGIFYPMLRTHAVSESWNAEPYLHTDILNDLRNFINMRYSWLAYNYTVAYQYACNGKPTSRPANFYDSNKERLANCLDEYLWGSDILVAPVVKNETSRKISFPEGRWLDLNDFNTVYNSGETNYYAPLNKLPHFLKEGATVVRYAGDNGTFTNTASIDKSKLIIDNFATSSPDMHYSYYYDDDFKSVNPVEEGKYSLIKFCSYNHSDTGNYVLSFFKEGRGYDGMPDKHDMLINIHRMEGLTSATEIAVITGDDGSEANIAERAPSKEGVVIPLTRYDSLEALKKGGDNGYYADTDKGRLSLNLHFSPGKEFHVVAGSDPGVMTGVRDVAPLGTMTLEFTGNSMNYSAPETTENLQLEIFSATGVKIAGYYNLSATGAVENVELDLPRGIYIGVLTGHSGGESRKVTEKILM